MKVGSARRENHHAAVENAQHDPALLRVDNLSSSELISAVNPKQFAMSGPVSGALPFWLDDESRSFEMAG
ncbi:intermembrane phospholipid transport protein YdbH family protein [Enterobacter hormaechei]